MARRPAPGTRARILAAASRLFDERGVRAVGMQQVIDSTGLGKSLLYREFESKDELVAAWLRERHARWREEADDALAALGDDPARQLVRVVELSLERQRSSRFRGCTFYSTVAEFRDPDHPGHRAAMEHLEAVRDRLGTLARAAGATDPTALADGLMLVVAGLYATGAAFGPDGPADVAVTVARSLVERYCPVSA